jgi:glycosyltransferase involved in cell wall biosynthesis
MRILMICNKSPYPKTDGGAIGLYNNITALSKAGYKIKVIAANTNKNWVKAEDVPDDFMAITNLELIPINLSLNVFSALYNLLSGQSYHISRFYTKQFENRIIEVLKSEEFDIIQLEYLPMALYTDIIRKHTKAPIVLRNHNVEYKIWEKITKNTKNPFKKWYLKQLVKTLKHFEISALRKADGIISTTTIDADEFLKLAPGKKVIAIPTSFNIEQLPDDYSLCGNPNIFHLGAMNWYPNEEGVKWFVQDVFHLIKNRIPEINLHLAGRNMTEWLTNLNVDGIIVDGEVDDAFDYMRKFDIMVVPLLSGSGIRVKIIEGMALGRAIVTTTIGAEGINVENNKNIIIADSPSDFADAVVSLYNDAEKRQQLSDNARSFVEQEHTSEKLMVKLTDFYNRLIK